MLNKHVKRFDEMEQKDIQSLIFGSDLFHWTTPTKEFKECIEILDWYNNLSDKEKKYIEVLRYNAKMQEYDTHCGEEL